VLASEVAAMLGRLSGRRVFASDLGGGGWCLGARLRTAGWFHGHLHISEYSRTLAGGATDPRHRVILGGVDTEKFSPAPDVPREPLVVFVGRLLPHKGVDVLVEALPPGMTLELIGRPYSELYHARLRELAAGKGVVFRTDCDDSEVVRAYRRATCVVLPSVYRDCYGNESRVPELLGQTPLEGMACGAAGIVTDVASLPEVVADGETGFVVPPNDPAALRAKLEWLRDNAADARAMGDAGRRWVLERFTWPTVVRRCLAAYAGGLA
jgi:glycosyltransferase involved in cell wall biosynthesis